ACLDTREASSPLGSARTIRRCESLTTKGTKYTKSGWEILSYAFRDVRAFRGQYLLPVGWVSDSVAQQSTGRRPRIFRRFQTHRTCWVTPGGSPSIRTSQGVLEQWKHVDRYFVRGRLVP